MYYKDLEPEAESIIKKDLELYNCMLHKAFKICFDRAYKDVTYSETDQRMIKSFYGTSDYFPLSTIYEAKALVKSDASIFIGQVKHLEFDLIRNQSH